MSDTGVQPAAESTSGLSQIQRVMNMFTAPSKIFIDIKNGRLSWWLPFILYVALGYAFYFAVDAKVGMRQAAENQIAMSAKTQERMSQLPAEQRESQMKLTVTITRIAFLCGPVFIVIMGLIISLIMWGTINFGFGGKATFAKVWVVWVYSMLPSVIKTLLGIIVLYAGAAPESFNSRNFAPTNLGAFLNPVDTNAALYSLASSIDAITIWTLVLVGMGTAIVAGVKRGSGYIASFGWWGLLVLLGVGWAAVMG
ncbi:MAG TPA: YIP1 family protein [Terracidiphilus sp.]|nr:YIP1 family protein [Terracidiphilus sp.]